MNHLKIRIRVGATLVALVASSLAQASDGCRASQELEARNALAGEMGLTLGSVQVVQFARGHWSTSTSDYAGFDLVTVGAHIDGQTIRQTYEVSAKRVGKPLGCTILGVTSIK